MWQRDNIKCVAGPVHLKLSANYLLELCALDELRNRETADRNDQSRLENTDLGIHPRRAIANFVGRRNTITAARAFARETTANRCEINTRSKSALVQPTGLFKPAEHRLAGGVPEWSL
jgi:hypothetical protein